MKPIVGVILFLMILATDIAIFIDEGRYIKATEKLDQLAGALGYTYVPESTTPGQYVQTGHIIYAN